MPGKAKAAKSPRKPTPATRTPRPKPARAAPKPKAARPAKPASSASVGEAWLRELGGWRAQTLGRMRSLIHEAEPGVVEEVKWRKPSNGMQGVLTWSHGGLVCTGEPYKDKVKLTFARGAALPDPAGLFNAADTGATRRAVDLREGDAVDAAAFKQLVRAAVAENGGS